MLTFLALMEAEILFIRLLADKKIEADSRK
jgi:hypothetical protein